MRYLLDTNAVSEPFRPAPSETLLRHLGEHKRATAISVITWQELVSGAARLPKGRRRAALERYHAIVRASFPMLAFDEAAATWAGREDARLARSGIAVSCEDLQIAAIAVAGGFTLVSADRAFRRFADLTVVDWTNAGRRR